MSVTNASHSMIREAKKSSTETTVGRRTGGIVLSANKAEENIQCFPSVNIVDNGSEVKASRCRIRGNETICKKFVLF